MRYVLICLAVISAGPAFGQQFTTAAEVRPILTATRANWVALRQYQGQDLLYFTQLENWRCGLSEVRFSVNGGRQKKWQLETCYENTPTPNAFQGQNRVPYTAFTLESVNEVSVTIFYDDGTSDSATYERKSILMP